MSLVKRREREGRELPEYWLERPVLHLDLQPVWDLFWVASIGRPRTQSGIAFIPAQEINAVLETYGYQMGSELGIEMFELVRFMDVTYVEAVKADKKPDDGDTPGSN